MISRNKGVFPYISEILVLDAYSTLQRPIGTHPEADCPQGEPKEPENWRLLSRSPESDRLPLIPISLHQFSPCLTLILRNILDNHKFHFLHSPCIHRYTCDKIQNTHFLFLWHYFLIGFLLSHTNSSHWSHGNPKSFHFPVEPTVLHYMSKRL